MAKSNKLIKVRVYYKNPIDEKSGVMQMREDAIKMYRENKASSPYKRIVRL